MEQPGASPPKPHYGEWQDNPPDREEIAVRVTAADWSGKDFDGSPFQPFPNWLRVAFGRGQVSGHTRGSTDYMQWDVNTADGTTVNATPGDYIILRENGKLSVVNGKDAFILMNLRPPLERLQALRRERDMLLEALAVPAVWSDEECAGMSETFKETQKHHGHYESLFAVGAWLLRWRLNRVLTRLENSEKPEQESARG